MRLFFFLLAIVPLTGFAQAYHPGYAITVDGDTIRGLLKHPFGSPYAFRFKEENNRKQASAEKNIKSFYIDKDGLYRSILFQKDGQRHVVYVVVDGYLSYYEVQLGPSSEGYFHILERQGDPDKFWFSADLFTGFKNGVVNYLKDDPALCEKIKNGDYSRRDIIAIVNAYNAFHAGTP